jgi:hypothetical protein
VPTQNRYSALYETFDDEWPEAHYAPRQEPKGEWSAVGPGRAAKTPAKRTWRPLYSLLRDSKEAMVCAVTTGTAHSRIIEAVIDSGAEESVAPPGLFDGTVSSSPMSRSGMKYRAANGTRIANLGQLSVEFATAEGYACGMPFQVAEVERPLVAVSQLAAAGNRVELNKDGGSITNLKTGKSIALVRKGGVYILSMLVAARVLDFPRQGR